MLLKRGCFVSNSNRKVESMARRGNGEGSVYKERNGLWAASITIEGGKRKYLYGKTRKEVQEKLATMVIYYHSVLHNALATAVKWGLVARNVCDLATPLRKARFEIQPFTAEQVQCFLAASRGHKWEALFTLALATGMRQGELLGLKWQDINFSAGTLQVRRILARIPPGESGKREFRETEPKTQKSRRSITVAPLALEVLTKHRVR